MLIQTRRSALVSLLATGAAVPVVLAARTAQAQTAPTTGGNQVEYVTQTLTVGTLALQTSQVAAEKATEPLVKEFAQLEISEQQAIASVLSATEAGATPPQLSPEQQALVQQLTDMQAGPEFDQAYIQGQIDGHNQLLEIQRTLSSETQATVEAITARLAEQGIMTHLAVLRIMQEMMASGAQQPAAAGQEQPAQGQTAPAETPPAADQQAPAAGETPAEGAAPPAEGATPPAEGATPPAAGETPPAGGAAAPGAGGPDAPADAAPTTQPGG